MKTEGTCRVSPEDYIKTFEGGISFIMNTLEDRIKVEELIKEIQGDWAMIELIVILGLFLALFLFVCMMTLNSINKNIGKIEKSVRQIKIDVASNIQGG